MIVKINKKKRESEAKFYMSSGDYSDYKNIQNEFRSKRI